MSASAFPEGGAAQAPPISYRCKPQEEKEMKRMSLLIKNGTIITSNNEFQGDI